MTNPIVKIFRSKLNTAVVLKKNHRAKFDNAYTSLLKNTRVGDISNSVKELLESRRCKSVTTADEDQELLHITPRNLERIKINDAFFSNHCVSSKFPLRI